jgi:DNA-binding winged helix-turn-helix (wHTH) protein
LLYRFGDCELDDRLFQLRKAGAVAHVEPRSFDLLLYLVRHRDRVVTKTELLEAVWQGVAVSDSVLSTAMNGVRRAIGATGRGGGPIETVYGRGYRFRAPVTEHADASERAAEPAVATARGEAEDPFVGREAVLAQLRAALERALAGEARTALLVGEAGIGKTRTVEELAREARARDALVLAARCPESAAAPAFWPWTQILRALLGGAGGDAKLPPELAVLVPELGGEAASETERFRLFDAITSALAAAAARRPLVVWIDDLQWADAASLQLAIWAARELRRAPVLFVATVREASDASPALRTALAELARLDHAQRIELEGLRAADVARYLELTVGAAPREAVEALLSRTEGNAFFLRELVRLGAGEASEAARLAAWTVDVPPGAREVVLRRVAALSDPARAVLAVAAVIGREFSLPLLAAAAEQGRDEILRALDHAAAARLVIEVPGAFARQRFAHALVCDALYDSIAPGERARVHERVGRALEALAPDRDEPAWAELAHHFHAAALRGCAPEAVRFAVLAARHAHARSAYEEAAAQYERALAAREIAGDAAPERPLDLLLAQGDAHLRAGDIAQTHATHERAANLARAAGDTEAFVRAALGFAGSALWGNRPDPATPALLEEALAALGDGAPARRAQLASRLAVIRAYQGSLAEEYERTEKALSLARETGDLEALSEALHARHYVLQGADHLDERADLARETLAIGVALGKTDRTFAIREAIASDCLVRGDRAGFEAAVEDAVRTAHSAHHPAFLWLATGAVASRALLEGRLGDAERAIAECASWGQRARNPGAIPLGIGHGFQLKREQGRLAELRPLFDAIGDRFDWIGAWPRVVRAVLHAELGDLDAARAIYEPLAQRGFRDLPRRADWLMAVADAALVCAALGDAARAETLDALLAPYDGLHAIFPGPLLYAGPVARFRGLLARTRGATDTAARQLESALAACAAVGARPAELRVACELGEVLAADGHRDDARTLLAEARQGAATLGMASVEARAAAALGGLGAR